MDNTREIMEIQRLFGMEKFSKRTVAEELERSRLIELLKSAYGTSFNAPHLSEHELEPLADHLIANGVTVQEQTMNVDRCVCCGAIIPEGRMVCPNCLATVKEG